MFNLGMTELMVLGIIALFVIGPERLPAAARNLASFLNDLKRSSSEFTKPIQDFKRSAHELVSEVKDQTLEHTGIKELKKSVDFKDDSDSHKKWQGDSQEKEEISSIEKHAETSSIDSNKKDEES